MAAKRPARHFKSYPQNSSTHRRHATTQLVPRHHQITLLCRASLTGRSHPMHGQMLALQLERLRLLDEQIAKLNSLIAQAMKPHQDAVIRLAEVPGLGIDSAQQGIAEVGVTASTVSSAAEFTSWVGTCPGKEESAEENSSSRSAKGNKYMRRVLNHAAHAAPPRN